MDIDCNQDQNKLVRKDMTAIKELTYFVGAGGGSVDITTDVGKKTYVETHADCTCKGYPVLGGAGTDMFIAPDRGAITLDACFQLCKDDTTLPDGCKTFLHSSKHCLLF